MISPFVTFQRFFSLYICFRLQERITLRGRFWTMPQTLLPVSFSDCCNPWMFLEKFTSTLFQTNNNFSRQCLRPDRMNQKLTLYPIPDYTTASRTLRHDPKRIFGSHKIWKHYTMPMSPKLAFKLHTVMFLRQPYPLPRVKESGFWNIITCEIWNPRL